MNSYRLDDLTLIITCSGRDTRITFESYKDQLDYLTHLLKETSAINY